MASSSMGASQLLGQEAAELADLGIPPLAEQSSGTPRPCTQSQPHCTAWTVSCFDLCLLPDCALVAAGPVQPSPSFFIYPCYF